MHHLVKPLCLSLVMSIFKGNVGDFHQPVRRQVFRHCGSQEGVKTGHKDQKKKMQPGAKKILSVETRGKE